MIPTEIRGWSVETGTRKSHIIGSTDIVVGTSSPGVVTVSFSLCGTTGHGEPAPEPSSVCCRRCLAIAFKQARAGQWEYIKSHCR